jgi:toluene monooxygenase electron transfer component
MNISIEDTETTFACKDDTILRAALRAGLGFPYACNTGSCGNCRFTLIEGEVAHISEPPAWSERDLKKNRWIGCQARPSSDCTIKVRLDPACVPTHRPRRRGATLTASTPVTHDIRQFTFSLAEPAQALPGQYALLYLPGMDTPRAYSMCEIAEGGSQWSFQIKLVPGGAGSSALQALQTGAEITLDGPYGTAHLRPDAPRDILCLAGGSGLSPMISIARAAASAPALADREIHFVYGGRMVRDICGESMLEVLPGYGERIHYLPVLSNHPIDDAQAWKGAQGFVHEAVAERYGDRLVEFEIYFAGPPPMAEAIKRMLFERGVPQDQVHYDEFY